MERAIIKLTLAVLGAVLLSCTAYAGEAAEAKTDKAACPEHYVKKCDTPDAKVVVPTDRPLSLKECISIALGIHPKVKAAEADLKAGEYRTREAIAAFWPFASFDMNRNYTHSSRPVRVGGPIRTVTSSYIANNFTFNTSWTLFDFGRTWFNVKTSASLEDSLGSDLTASEQTVAYDVMDAYLTLLRAQSLVKVAQETKDNADSHLKQAQAFFEVGVKPRFDVTSAEVEVNNAQLTVITSRDAVKLARYTLNVRLGIDPLTPITVEDIPILKEPEKPLDDYYKEAVINRPEIQSLEKKLKAGEMAVKAAFSDYLPTVSASATQSWYKEDHTDFTDSQNAQLMLDIPIFEGFLTTAKFGEAKANYLSTRYKLEDLKLSVLQDVSNAYLLVVDAKARMETLESSVKKARENLDIAKGRYDAGVGALIEVTDAQVNLTSAETDEAQAISGFQLGYARLMRNVGMKVK